MKVANGTLTRVFCFCHRGCTHYTDTGATIRCSGVHLWSSDTHRSVQLTSPVTSSCLMFLISLLVYYLFVFRLKNVLALNVCIVLQCLIKTSDHFNLLCILSQRKAVCGRRLNSVPNVPNVPQHGSCPCGVTIALLYHTDDDPVAAWCGLLLHLPAASDLVFYFIYFINLVYLSGLFSFFLFLIGF